MCVYMYIRTHWSHKEFNLHVPSVLVWVKDLVVFESTLEVFTPNGAYYQLGRSGGEVSGEDMDTSGKHNNTTNLRLVFFDCWPLGEGFGTFLLDILTLSNVSPSGLSFQVWNPESRWKSDNSRLSNHKHCFLYFLAWVKGDCQLSKSADSDSPCQTHKQLEGLGIKDTVNVKWNWVSHDCLEQVISSNTKTYQRTLGSQQVLKAPGGL